MAAPVLNLNNEVVKMRKEVKKIRVLTIRKLTRHLAKLKSKKGTQEDILRNQRRAQRLLEEIHAMKEVKPDDVTKTALQKEINFEKVCKMPGSTAEERAIARLGTHPQFKKKIDDIKAAVQAFKEERLNPATAVYPSVDSVSDKDLKPVQRDVTITEQVENKAANSTKEDSFHDREGKKTNTKELSLKAVERETASIVPSQIKEPNTPTIPKENEMSISKDTMPIFLKQDTPISPRRDASAPQKQDTPSSPKQDMPADPKRETPAALEQDMATATKVDIPASPSKGSSALSVSDVPKQGLPTDPTDLTDLKKDVSKETTSVIAEIGDRSTEGASLASIVCISDATQHSMHCTSKVDVSVNQTKKLPFAPKGKNVELRVNEETGKGLDCGSSDIEDSDKEEREYFDDSTEERFHKQSSGPDDSDSEDDFFIGKVKQAKKRKGCKTPTTKSKAEEHTKTSEKEPTTTPGTAVTSGASKPNIKAQKLESVFCHSLAESKHKSKMIKRNFKDEPKMNKRTAFPQTKPQVMKHQLDKKFPTAKKENKKQPLHVLKRENKKQELQQPLHPSWEASKKRKEQQCLITAFQGKKIRFDD
ncbi:serum response factor-binding protein 1 [Lissotriton helveticus]